jgi:hypothetical protein
LPFDASIHSSSLGRNGSINRTVAEVVRVTLNETPADTSTQWSTRTLAKRMGIGKDSVARIWRDHELKPWKIDTFKLSNDPGRQPGRGWEARAVRRF